jgi:transposase
VSDQSEEKTYPSVRKRTNLEREDHLHKIAGLYLEGRSQKEIAERFGLSKSQISRDLKEIHQRWKSEIGNEKTLILRAKELERIDHLEDKASKAFERSCMAEETQSQEKISPDAAENVAGSRAKKARTAQGGRLKASIRTKDRDGNPAFLRVIAECIKMRCALLGVEAPKKKEHSSGDKPVQLQYIEVIRPSPGAVSPESPPEPPALQPPPPPPPASVPPPDDLFVVKRATPKSNRDNTTIF